MTAVYEQSDCTVSLPVQVKRGHVHLEVMERRAVMVILIRSEHGVHLRLKIHKQLSLKNS